MKVIVLASINHTGTFFVEHFFRNHSAVDACVGLTQVIKNDTLLFRRVGSGAYEEGLRPAGTTLVQGHLNNNNVRHLQLLSLFNPMIVPMRDPLLALISTVVRNPGNDPMHQVDQLLALGDCFIRMQHVYQPFFLPVDLLAKETGVKRYEALRDMQHHCGIKAEVDYTRDVAKSWEYVNSGGDYGLKRSYVEGDKKPIWAKLAAPIGIMQSYEDKVRPMLENIGYRDLLWWS